MQKNCRTNLLWQKAHSENACDYYGNSFPWNVSWRVATCQRRSCPVMQLHNQLIRWRWAMAWERPIYMQNLEEVYSMEQFPHPCHWRLSSYPPSLYSRFTMSALWPTNSVLLYNCLLEMYLEEHQCCQTVVSLFLKFSVIFLGTLYYIFVAFMIEQKKWVLNG